MKRKLKLPGRFALTSVAASLCLASPLASALGLGRLNVQSALGEVLRAEIEVTSLTPEEQASLRIRVAPPESYRAANVDYNAVLPSTRATFEKRPDGRLFVRLVSDRGVQEPFVDVILEISWATGRLVREYTLLFDPPATIRAGAQPAPGTTTSPVMSATPPPPTPLAQSTPTTPAMTKAEQREAARAEARERRAAAQAAAAEQRASRDAASSAAPAPRASAATTASGEGAATSEDEVHVRSGDTLSKIAIHVQRPGVSLDQMLVSLFRSNPDAFSGKNMNRLRAGVVLSVPSAETAQAVPAGEARQVITAQSADFGAYRQRLAEATTGAAPEVEPNRRRSGGKVQASVEDKKLAANTSPDQLKLSKGGATPPSAPGSAEDRMATERQRQAEAARVAELNKNLSDLNRVRGGASQTTPAPGPAATVTSPTAAAPAAVAGARPTSSPVAVVTPVPTPTAPLTAPTTTAAAPTIVGAAPPSASAATVAPAIASASMPAAPASAAMVVAAAGSAAAPPVVARPASAARPRPAARPAPEPSFIDSITSGNPLYLGGGALALLLLGYGAYRYTQRSKKDSGETSFLESRLQPDSFFGASGGQRIDTRDAAGSSSSMTYSLSQLDAIGDVDPVAEADVYLAYGRDLQAEEILKEAMRSNPERLAIRTKLLEVYAKRRDIKGFELLATQLFALTRGEGDDWAKAQELGAQIDPDNAMYRIGGTPGQNIEGASVAEPLGASTLPQSVMPVPSQFGSTIGNTTARDSAFDNIDLDLDNPDIGSPSRPAALDATEAIPPRPAEPASYNTTLKMPLVANEAGAVELARRDEPLPFDLSGISLDLDPAETAGEHNTTPAGFDDNGDPLSRKLELAEEFQRIGDKDGARDLLREVLATASGATKTKAQGMLDRIS
ncbi:MAG TPA: FimV/HubP family polar landmark protein [Caldimonas sp.]